MQALLSSEPSFTEPDRQVLASLEATLRPSVAKPGTIEAMIDGLVNVSDIYQDSRSPDPLVLKLSQLGFEAVPALLVHWDDARLTRGASPRVMNSEGYLVPVSAAVRNLVWHLAGDGLAAGLWSTGKAEALVWWKGARRMGEEVYLVAHVLPAGQEEEWPNRTMLRIIAAKYPRHLPGIYRTILEKRPRFISADVVDWISKSSLPRETKRELLRRGANHRDLEHRRYALSALKDLNTETFLRVLIATLESLPKTPVKPYWKCPEATYVHLVMQTGDPGAWAALEKAAKRSDVGLRMEIMNPMNYTYIADRYRRQRLQFLSHFLDDDDVRDKNSNPKLYDGPCAWVPFPQDRSAKFRGHGDCFDPRYGRRTRYGLDNRAMGCAARSGPRGVGS